MRSEYEAQGRVEGGSHFDHLCSDKVASCGSPSPEVMRVETCLTEDAG